MKTKIISFAIVGSLLLAQPSTSQIKTVYAPGSTNAISGNYFDQSAEIRIDGLFYMFGDWIVQSPFVICTEQTSFADGNNDLNNTTGRLFFDNITHAGYPAGVVAFTPSNISFPLGTSIAIGNKENISIAGNSFINIGGALHFSDADYAGTAIGYGGHLIMNTSGLNISNTGTITGYSTNHYVVTNITALGVTKQDMTAGSSFLFPVGSDIGNDVETDYTPLLVINGSNAQDVNALVRPFDPSEPTSDVPYWNLLNKDSVMKRAWRISSPNNDAGPIQTFTLTHNGSSNAQFYNPPSAQLIRYNIASSKWRGVSGSTGDKDVNGQLELTAPDVTALQGAMYASSSENSWFTKYPVFIAPLPLTWLSFNAEKSRSNVLLKWTTASEINTDKFSVEYGIDGISWRSIGTVPALGSINAGDYQYLHTNPSSGDNYYRIKEIDKDGRFSYSSIKSVHFDGGKIKTWPNPAINELNVSFAEKANYAYKLVNVQGQIVAEQNINNTDRAVISTSAFAAGTYNLMIFRNNKMIAVERIFISK